MVLLSNRRLVHRDRECHADAFSRFLSSVFSLLVSLFSHLIHMFGVATNCGGQRGATVTGPWPPHRCRERNVRCCSDEDASHATDVLRSGDPHRVAPLCHAGSYMCHSCEVSSLSRPRTISEVSVLFSSGEPSRHDASPGSQRDLGVRREGADTSHLQSMTEHSCERSCHLRGARNPRVLRSSTSNLKNPRDSGGQLRTSGPNLPFGASSGWCVILSWRLKDVYESLFTLAARRNSSPECMRHRSRCRPGLLLWGVGHLPVIRTPLSAEHFKKMGQGPCTLAFRASQIFFAYGRTDWDERSCVCLCARFHFLCLGLCPWIMRVS